MEIRRAALGERHPDYAASLNNLAALYRATGRHAEAEPLYLQAMELRRTALGERHPDYAASLNNLAVLYRAMGRHAEAEPLFRQAMEIRRTALGERHPDYAASLNNLAALYQAMGRYAEAEPLYCAGDGAYAAPPCKPSRLRHSLNNLAELPERWAGTPRPSRSPQAIDILRSTLGRPSCILTVARNYPESAGGRAPASCRVRSALAPASRTVPLGFE